MKEDITRFKFRK